jgi:hypothetical protein
MPMAEIWDSQLEEMESRQANPYNQGLKNPVAAHQVDIFHA